MHKSLNQRYASQKPIQEWSVELPDDKDYQNHSVEIKMPSLSVGQYLILVGTDSEFTYIKNAVGYSRTWVTNISYIRKDTGENKVLFYALNRKSGQPFLILMLKFGDRNMCPMQESINSLK